MLRPIPPAGEDPAQHLLELVRTGPNEVERRDGFRPLGSRRVLRDLTVTVTEGVAVVDRKADDDFILTVAMPLPELALERTLREAAGIKNVEFRVDGVPTCELSDEAIC